MEKTLANVIAWLISKGAPLPTYDDNVILYPGGSYRLATLRFKNPNFVAPPDLPEWMNQIDLAATAGTYVIPVDMLMMDNGATALRELQTRGMAQGDPNVVVNFPN